MSGTGRPDVTGAYDEVAHYERQGEEDDGHHGEDYDRFVVGFGFQVNELGDLHIYPIGQRRTLVVSGSHFSKGSEIQDRGGIKR